jgi:hypothetical protein
MDNQKRCGVGKTCRSFQFAQHLVEFDTTTIEGIPSGHPPFQPIHHWFNSLRNSNFHHLKDGGQDVPPIGIGYYQSTNQANQQYNRLQDSFSLMKLGANRDNTKFGIAQVVNITLWNLFSIESTFIILVMRRRMKVWPGLHRKLRLHEATKF